MTDKALVRYAEQFRDGLLGDAPPGGWCAMVCWPLETLLRINRVAVKATELSFPSAAAPASNHVILQLTDGRILDPTADQFGLSRVYLGPMPQIYLDWQREEP